MKKHTWAAIALPLAIVYLAVPFLLKDNHYILSMTVSSLIVAGIAVAWALLGNLGGMVSFGHAAFFGLGAYASALLSMKLHLPVLLTIPLGGVFAAIASLAMLPALRLSGPYFALAILAYAHIFRILATEFSSLTGGSSGISSIPGLPAMLSRRWRCCRRCACRDRISRWRYSRMRISSAYSRPSFPRSPAAPAAFRRFPDCRQCCGPASGRIC